MLFAPIVPGGRSSLGGAPKSSSVYTCFARFFSCGAAGIGEAGDGADAPAASCGGIGAPGGWQREGVTHKTVIRKARRARNLTLTCLSPSLRGGEFTALPLP